MRYFGYFLSCLILSITAVSAQEKWDLQKIVDYARANNITVKQSAVQADISQLTYNQSKLRQYPNASFNINAPYNNGRTQDPITYNLVTQSYISSGVQLQTSVDIFNWANKKNTILANQWQLEADRANTDKLKNDIALTAANSYLQILLSKEQENIALVQLRQTQAQLANTRKLVNAGSLPELNAAELEAQEARDSATYISARGNVAQAILVLKSNMNLDAAAPFDVFIPPVEMIPVENIADLQPDYVYGLAVAHLPQQRVNTFRIKAAQKFAEAARSNMYPVFTAFANLNSAYNSIYDKNSLFQQYNQNFRQSVGVAATIPIFNGSQLRTNWERSKLNIKTVEMQQEADNQQIKQDIYQAYNAAMVALEKFNSSRKSVEASQRTLEFAQKRYNVGMLGTFELITNQNNLFRAKLEYVVNQYDFVFKMKVLEFYKGQGLKL